MNRGKNTNKWKEIGEQELIKKIILNQCARNPDREGLELPIEFFQLIIGVNINANTDIDNMVLMGKKVKFIT